MHHKQQVNTIKYPVCCNIESMEEHKYLYVETRWIFFIIFF